MGRYGLVGAKLGASFSKEIHNALADYNYEMIECSEEEFKAFMSSRDFSAINVTIPYKEKVIDYLDDIDEVAARIGAVNTVVNKDGKLYGYNTDIIGLEKLITSSGILLEGKTVMILGSGGTSKTAIETAKKLNAGKIIQVSRNGGEDKITYQEAVTKNPEVIINTTPVGMNPLIEDMPIDISNFDKLEAVFDVVYNPLKTKLIQSAESRGITAAGGLCMLVWQAVVASSLFTSTEIEYDKAQSIYNKTLQEKQNIVLIGMPASGKTTISKILAEKTDRVLIDTDEEVITSAKKSIAEIFEQDGEKEFRSLEKQAVLKASLMSGAIISTGGGVVLNSENIENLKKNGRIFFLDRLPENIKGTKDRPLATTQEQIEKLYKERYQLYKKSADVLIDNNKEEETAVAKILEVFYETISN